VFDVTNPGNPQLLGLLDSVGYSMGILVTDTLVLLANGNEGLWIINARNPAEPRLVSRIPAARREEPVWSCWLDGQLVYVANGLAGLEIYDIADPLQPVRLGGYDTDGAVYGVEVRYPYAYLADGGYGCRILDVSDPTSPQQAGHLLTPGNAACDIALDGGLAYVADGPWGVRAIRVTDPQNPTEVGYYHIGGYSLDVEVADGKVYVANQRGWRVLERHGPGVAEPPGPETEASWLRVRYDRESSTICIVAQGRMLDSVSVLDASGRLELTAEVRPSAKGGAIHVPATLSAGVHVVLLHAGHDRFAAKLVVPD
jgi:hypothetical protein